MLVRSMRCTKRRFESSDSSHGSSFEIFRNNCSTATVCSGNYQVSYILLLWVYIPWKLRTLTTIINTNMTKKIIQQ